VVAYLQQDSLLTPGGRDRCMDVQASGSLSIAAPAHDAVFEAASRPISKAKAAGSQARAQEAAGGPRQSAVLQRRARGPAALCTPATQALSALQVAAHVRGTLRGKPTEVKGGAEQGWWGWVQVEDC
jgi:hypothetical protein